MSEPLEIISPPTKLIKFMGREIELAPVPMGRMQEFTLAVRPIAADLFTALEGTGDVLQTIELHGDRMITAVAIATGIDRKELQALQIDQFLLLTEEVVQVNADFFVRRLIPSLLPLFKRAVEGINRKMKSGQT